MIVLCHSIVVEGSICHNIKIIAFCLNLLIGFDCDDGWQKFENSCYKMFIGKKNWMDAESECVKNGAHLTSIHSANENAFVMKLQDQTGTHITLIGGQRDGSSFKWSNGKAFNYQNWVTGQPDNAGGKENCAELYSAPGKTWHSKWNDIPCDVGARADRYVCKKDK